MVRFARYVLRADVLHARGKCQQRRVARAADDVRGARAAREAGGQFEARDGGEDVLRPLDEQLGLRREEHAVVREEEERRADPKGVRDPDVAADARQLAERRAGDGPAGGDADEPHVALQLVAHPLRDGHHVGHLGAAREARERAEGAAAL